jgi:hypothetical protein
VPPAERLEWSRTISARQAKIRDAHLAHAAALATGDADDRRLARDVERFVAQMPVALTRRQALAVELRRALERENGAGGAKADGPAKAEEVLHGANVLADPGNAKVLHPARHWEEKQQKRNLPSGRPKLRGRSWSPPIIDPNRPTRFPSFQPRLRSLNQM